MIAGDGNRTNARKNSCTRQKRTCEFMLYLEIRPHSEISRVSRRGKLVLGFQNALGFKTGADPLQGPETSNQQRGTADEEYRERELCDNEHSANSTVSCAGRSPSGVLRQRGADVESASLQCRNECEQQPDRYRYGKRHEKHAHVHSRQSETWNIRRCDRHQGAHASKRERDADGRG